MTERFLTQFAQSSDAGSGNIFEALGIDWQMLIFQIIGFLVLVFVMGKWVYPVLMKTVDERQAKIDAGTKAAAEAQKHAEKAEADIKKLMDQAKKDAAGIVATAHDEAQNTLSEATDKAKKNAEHIIENAHEQIERDVASARKALQRDTMSLVAQATEKVVGQSVSKSVDESLIKRSIEEAK